MNNLKLTECHLADQVLLELSEVRDWWKLQSHFSKELQLHFLSGKPTKQAPREIIVPLASSSRLSPCQIQNYINTVRLSERTTTGLTLAIGDGDSTTAYYKVTAGLVQPPPADLADRQKQVRYERQQVSRRHTCEQTSAYIHSLDVEQRDTHNDRQTSSVCVSSDVETQHTEH